MEKSILILGSDDHSDYSVAHERFKQLGLGYIIKDPVYIISSKGISNHVYHYYKYNNLDNVRRAGPEGLDVLVKEDLISKVMIFGKYDKHITLLKTLRKKGITIEQREL